MMLSNYSNFMAVTNKIIEKIERILYNNKLWHELALDCRKNVHRFNWKTEEKKLLYLYKNILVKD